MRISHALCVVFGALATAFAAPLFEPEPAAPARAPTPTPSDPRVEQILARLDALGARGAGPIDELRARVDAIEERLAAERVAHAEDAVGEYPSLPLEEEARARYLSVMPEQEEKAIAAWTAIAAGTADPERQAEAYFEIGEAYLRLKNAPDAAKAFAKVVDRLGLGVPRGQFAAHKQGMCEYWSGDKAAAYRAFRRIADAPTMIHCTAPTMRHWAAVLAARTGDLDYARRELRAYVADYDNEQHAAFAGMVESARKLLAEIGE